MRTTFSSRREFTGALKQVELVTDLKIGKLLSRRDTIAVFVAEKDNDGGITEVALKILTVPARISGTKESELNQRFLREAEAASSIKHPNIVRVLDFGVTDGVGLPYLVMELVKGHTLNHYIGRENLLGCHRKVLILRQIAAALMAIHADNICHRDIKPDNILVDHNLRARVTDFGIVKLPDSDLTKLFTILGTRAYIAPEAFASGRVDERADLFAFGVVAHELLLGGKPDPFSGIGGDTPGVLRLRSSHAPRRSPSIPVDLQRILKKSLQPDPGKRYQTAGDLFLDLDEFICHRNQ